jgi:WD40 repeat protein/predicted MPP superfamily phosphohydrolase
MTKKNWIHLSDIHFNFENYDTMRMRSRTFKYLEKIGIQFDFMVITGDFRYKDSAYTDKTIDFINRVLEILMLDKDNLFIVPGNHDVKRTSRRTKLIKGILSSDDPCEEVNKLDNEDLETYNELMSGQEEFFAFYQKVLGKEYPRDDLHFVIKRNGYNIIHVNTCFVSGYDNEDKEACLLIGQKKLNLALQNIDPNVFSIAIGHHSIDCLKPEERERFMNNLSDYSVDVYLSGHVHQPKATVDPDNIKNIYLFGCGSGMSDNYSNVGIITGVMDIESGEGGVTFHKWEPIKEFWRVANDLSRKVVDGVYTFNINKNSTPNFGVNSNTNLNSTQSFKRTLLDASKEHLALMKNPGGRFYHLNITDIILPGVVGSTLDIGISINGSEKIKLNKSLEQLWEKECRHAFITGEGGRGKTVSLVRLWEEHVSSNIGNMPVPIFIDLNEYNNANEDFKKVFIRNTIGKEYLGKVRLSDEENNKLWDFLRKPLKDGQPSVILLLDGFNEVTADKRDLLIELNDIIRNCNGVQIVITSRVDMRNTLNLVAFNQLELMELDEMQVRSYIESFPNASMPQGDLLGLVKNPMMLTIHASTCQIVDINKDNINYIFKKKIQTAGELLWNFVESLVVKHDTNLEKNFYYRFILKHLLPYIGWRMEKNGVFYLSSVELYEVIKTYFESIYSSEFFSAFPYFMEYEEKLCIGIVDEKKERERFSRVRKALTDELVILIDEKDRNRDTAIYRFFHQNFRDYFAAVHILNEIQFALSKKTLPEIIQNAPISFYVGKYMGEIEGEHNNVPVIDTTNETWSVEHYRSTRLRKVLESCRGNFGQRIGFIVWNIIEIFKNVRGELTGEDLSNLNLSNVILNMVRCSRVYGNKSITTLFDYSLLNEKNIFPQGHSSAANSAIYSSDDKRILSASGDKTIKEWDALTGECLRTYWGHTSGVNSAIYSSDDTRILSASDDYIIKEWDVLTGKCLCSYKSHSEKVNNAVYSNDGKRILSVSGDKTIKEWDIKTGKCLHTHQGYSFVNSAVYSSDGKRILSAYADNTIKEWDAMTWECLRIYEGHTSAVNSAVYSSDGNRILSASGDDTIKEWDAVTRECLYTYKGHLSAVNSGVNSLTYSSAGKRFLSASGDNTIKEWDVKSRECLRTYLGHSFVNTAIYSGDGKRILSASYDKTIKEWDADTGECLRSYHGHSSAVNNAVYSGDGKRILLASGDNTIKEWDAVTWKCLRIYQGHTSAVNSVAYSSDGKRVLSASGDCTIKEWDADTGECLRSYHGHSSAVNGAVYSSTGKRILSASGDDTIKEWDANTGVCLRTYKGHTSAVNRAIYSNDDKKILSASGDKTIKEWDALTGECLRTYPSNSFINSAVYSIDSKRILSASGDSTIKEWNVLTGECLRTYHGHSAAVNSAVYCSDDKKILSASDDHTIKEWDMDSGECLSTYPGHSNDVHSAVYSGDGKRILSASGDDTIKEWDINIGKCANTVENIPGLILQECSFKNLQAMSVISDRCKELLEIYGIKGITIDKRHS